MCASASSPAANDMAAKLAAGTLPPGAPRSPRSSSSTSVWMRWLAMLFTAILWFVILDMVRISVRRLRGQAVPASSEAPYRATRMKTLILGGAS